MWRHSFLTSARRLGGVCVVLLATALGSAQEMGPPRALGERPSGPVEVVPRELQRGKQYLIAGPSGRPYWIGAGCSPVPDALRAQLKLPEGEGLLVEEIAENSPAVAAGLQRFDVLLKVDGKPLKCVNDLIEAIQAAKGRKMSLELIRKGHATSAEVTPAKRPAEALAESRSTGPEMDWDDLRRMLEHGSPMTLRFLRPGVLLPPGAALPNPIPDDMTISITKQGEKPAKVVITQKDRTWEATEDHLDKLPAEVRPHAERLLGRFAVEIGQPGRPWPKPGDSKRQLDEMARQIERLQKAMEELRASHGEK